MERIGPNLQWFAIAAVIVGLFMWLAYSVGREHGAGGAMETYKAGQRHLEKIDAQRREAREADAEWASSQPVE